jgi:PST family polysaccharide transporter
LKTLLNFFYLLVSKGAGLILFTLVTPLLIGRIGIDGLGKVSMVIAFAFIFDSFVEYAFNITIVKDIAVHREDKNYINSIFYNTLFAKLFLFLIGSVIAILVVNFNSKYYDIKELFFISFLFVLARALMPIWYFLGTEKMQGITIVSILSKLGYFLSVFLFIKSHKDVFNVLFFFSLSEFIPSVLALVYVVFNDKISFKSSSVTSIVQLLRRDFVFSLSLFFFRIYTYIPILIIGQVCNEFLVGIYSVADKIIAIIKDTIGLLFNSILPRVSNLYNQSIHKAKNYLMQVSIVFTSLYILGILLLHAFSNRIILFFTNQSVDEIKQVLLILSISCIFVLLRIPSSIYIVIKRLDRMFTISIAICTFSCIFTTYLLAKNYQIIGVSFALLFSEFLLFLILGVNTFKKIKGELNVK